MGPFSYIFKNTSIVKNIHDNEMRESMISNSEIFKISTNKIVSSITPNEFSSNNGGLIKDNRKYIHELINYDLISYILMYMYDNQIGLIANSHLILSDYYGIENANTLLLNRIFCRVVDFSSQGYFFKVPFTIELGEN